MKTETLIELWKMDRKKPAWLTNMMENLDLSDEQVGTLIERDDYFNELNSIGHYHDARSMSDMIKEIPVGERRDMRLRYLVARKEIVESELKKLRETIKKHDGVDEFTSNLIMIQSDSKNKTRELWSIVAEISMLKKPESDRKDRLMPDEIEIAKGFPVEQLLNKNRGERIPCPYHGGKDKNMMLKGFAYCFVCNVSADAIKWLMDFNGLSFRQAVEELS